MSQLIHLSQTTLSHRTLAPQDWLELVSPRQPCRWPRQTSPAGFCCKFSQWGPPLLAPADKGERRGSVSQEMWATRWGLDVLPSPVASGEKENYQGTRRVL